VLGAAIVLSAGNLHAQVSDGVRHVALTASIHAGGTAFTRFQLVTVEAPGSPEGSYSGSLAASTAASLGANLTAWFTPWLGARLHFGYAPATFEVRLTEEDREDVLGDASGYQALSYSDMSVFTISGAAVLVLPIPSTRVAPYVLVGAGGSLFTADDRGAQGLDSAFAGHDVAMRGAGVAGIGVTIPLTAARVSLSFELTDHMTVTPIEANDGRVLLDDAQLRVVNRVHASVADASARYIHAIGIAAGLSFAIGGSPPGQ